MSWKWTRLPPVMDRSPRDDAKWLSWFLLGATVAWLVFARDDPGTLVGSFVGILIVFVGVTVVRRVVRRRKT